MTDPDIPSLPPGILHEAVARALGEDRGPADITSSAAIPKELTASARIFVKEIGILSGVHLAEKTFLEENHHSQITIQKSDGSELTPGDTILTINGNARSILTAERVALNFLQHMSGIASKTRRFVDACKPHPTKILDTRKTAPGLRAIQKYAVLCGGGQNHRMGLYDAFMIKDNHVALAQQQGTSLSELVAKLKAFSPDSKLIFEADTLDQVKTLAAIPQVDQILLDNMSTDQLRTAVSMVNKTCLLEASGNITLERVPEVSATGVDFISVGSLTHSVTALDFSLEITFHSTP